MFLFLTSITPECLDKISPQTELQLTITTIGVSTTSTRNDCISQGIILILSISCWSSLILENLKNIYIYAILFIFNLIKIFYLRMLSKVFTRMFSTTPNVWVNKHTKVICQGITGNQVIFILYRELSRHNKLSITEHRWSVESIPKRLDQHTWDYQSLKIVYKLKKPLDATLQSFTSHLQERLMRSLRPYKHN